MILYRDFKPTLADNFNFHANFFSEMSHDFIFRTIDTKQVQTLEAIGQFEVKVD